MDPSALVAPDGRDRGVGVGLARDLLGVELRLPGLDGCGCGCEGWRPCGELQAFEDPTGHLRVGDGGEHADALTARRAAQSVELEDALEELGPGREDAVVADLVGPGRGMRGPRRSSSSRRSITTWVVSSRQGVLSR